MQPSEFYRLSVDELDSLVTYIEQYREAEERASRATH
jgi:hypothetical protein